jgi:hypothetical protein
MTTSRMGIIGRRFVSDFSFEVSIVPLQGLTLSLASHSNHRLRFRGFRSYPAFSNIVRLIFCDSTISFVTENSRTFL